MRNARLKRRARSDIGGERHTGQEGARIGEIEIGNRICLEERAVYIIMLIEQIADQPEQLDILGKLI